MMGKEKIRKFETGAIRDVDFDKLDYDGFLSPIAVRRFALYMHKHRTLKDGTLRDSDNWQKGIPKAQYRKSLFRHIIDAWTILRGWMVKTKEGEDIEDLLCAIIFNSQGLLHEILREKINNEKEIRK